MTPAQNEKLILAAWRLRQNNVELWEEFVRAVETVYTTERENCVNSSPESFLKVQGRAQIAREIHALFTNLPAVTEKIQQRGPRK